MDAEVYASSERESLFMAASVSVCMCVRLCYSFTIGLLMDSDGRKFDSSNKIIHTGSEFTYNSFQNIR